MIEKLENIISENPKMSVGLAIFIGLFIIEFIVMYMTAFNTVAFGRVYKVVLGSMIAFIIYSVFVGFTILIKK